ncbi:uncharacterized protein VTP21DRAFT_6065 [Calcarisporiella thermophila]|uniref:uncharacterized protein n=1 Tax=Calcarisporiella thermophila TaxID=911321 RepID=UPI003741F18C
MDSQLVSQTEKRISHRKSEPHSLAAHDSTSRSLRRSSSISFPKLFAMKSQQFGNSVASHFKTDYAPNPSTRQERVDPLYMASQIHSECENPPEQVSICSNGHSPRPVYYDSPIIRRKLRTYFSDENFDEVVERGFPTSSSLDEERLPTIRLTLTPSHMLENDADIYVADENMSIPGPLWPVDAPKLVDKEPTEGDHEYISLREAKCQLMR